MAASPIAVGILLVGIYPYAPATALVCIALFVAALPVCVALEFLGGILFNSEATAQIPGGVPRILYGVIAATLFLLVAWFAFSFAKPFFEPWGA